DAKEDLFLESERPGPNGQPARPWLSARAEAERLFAQTPAAGQEQYRLQYGRAASELLKEAKVRDDARLLDEVARRYYHTPAGLEALDLLATQHLDRGRSADAALCFERLLRFEMRGGKMVPRAADQVAPLTLFKAALAFRLAGDATREDLVWKA